MDISVIIPVFNEEKNIPLLYARLNDTVRKICTTYEYIFVNDGSADASMQVIRSLAETDDSVKFIDFSRNFGHQIAVTAGLAKAKGQAVVIIDADLQDPPELIEPLYRKMQAGYEVVYAKRRSREGESFMKKWTAKMFYRLLSRMTAISIPLDTGDYRIIHQKVVQMLNRMPEQQKFIRGQIAWVGFRQTFLEYDRQARHAGTTGYSYAKMLKFAIDGITSFSDVPLKFATISGFVVSGVAFIEILYALHSRLITKDYEPGWASILISILFLGGIQLMSIGIIGEYLSRISTNVKNRPLYVINETNIE
ncbi:glycosyl transferase family 2 [Chloroherpeton thalassium ATCC 35110]|uniref:Glycosyl transferase family 2 n=1 Tax=Chloroherpeton thalassium (strain ATCC 35110 / GB-78) TaxID=517418 RepID=B3QVA5_CHLT3|nr:glycosyltransferase family 2 protein [Chloroherpeton thalassium]ACF13059.1 glycosyl transferase family 2 [Chloroherpeton thalassium ATCC 35110]